MQLRGITVWDGVNDLGPTNLSWDDDQIDEVTPAPRDQHKGLAVIPGLIDTHVHLSGPAILDDDCDYTFGTWQLVTSREEQTLHVAAHAVRAMRAGITTLRDMAGDQRQIAVRNAFDAELLVGPRLFVFGLVGMTAGHGDMSTPPGATQRPPTADGPDACRALVRRYARDGVDGIKIAASGGVFSRGDATKWRNHTREEVAAIIDEAHALGLPVAAHAHTEAGIELALAEGVDSLEHGTLITGEQAERAADYGVTVAPTLLSNDRLADGTAPASEGSRAKAKELVVRRDIRLRKAREAGVPFVLGTDSNGHNLPFGSTLEELIRHRDVLGMTDAKALASGTSEAAEALGAGGRLGRIAPGYGADLLVVRARPWQDISTLTPANLVAVICRGQVVTGELPQEQPQPEPRPVTLLRDPARDGGRDGVRDGGRDGVRDDRPDSARDDLRESLRGSLEDHL